MTIPAITFGGRPFATEFQTLVVEYPPNRTELLPTVTGRRVGHRTAIMPSRISASLYPFVEADEPHLETLLSMGGVVPVRLPDGSSYAVSLESEQTSQGWHANATRRYPTSWIVEHDVALADWLGYTNPALSLYSSNPTGSYHMTGVGNQTLLANIGWQLTGTGAWGAVDIREGDYPKAPPRPQPVLHARLRINASLAEVALGFEPYGLTSPTTPLRAGGIGVLWNYNSVTAVLGDSTVGTGTAVPIASPVADYYVTIAARHGGARLEVWREKTRILFLNAVAWTMPTGPGLLGPVLRVRSQSATLKQWWIHTG